MGLSRLILALLVACSHLSQSDHTKWWTGTAPVFAVKAFFVASGFYMALVLNGGYRGRPVRDFYASRALRLLPAYWMVSAVTLLAVLALAGTSTSFSPLLNPVQAWRSTNPSAWSWSIWAYVLLSLTTLIGSDTWLWLGFNASGASWNTAPAYGPNATSALALSFVPQAWTIGVELLFYLLAPFIVTRRLRHLVVLAAGSLAFRFVLARMGFAGEPWSRALLPSELIYFVGGILAYRIYVVCENRRIPAWLLWAALAVTLSLELSIPAYISSHADTLFINTAPFVVLVATTPFVFMLTRGNALDSFLGNLAYPVYLVHILVFGVVNNTPIKFLITKTLGTEWLWVVINLMLVVLASCVVEVLAIRRVDGIRVRLGARQRGVELQDRPTAIALGELTP